MAVAVLFDEFGNGVCGRDAVTGVCGDGCVCRQEYVERTLEKSSVTGADKATLEAGSPAKCWPL